MGLCAVRNLQVASMLHLCKHMACTCLHCIEPGPMIVSSPQVTACLAKQHSSNASHATCESIEQWRCRLDTAHDALMMLLMKTVAMMKVSAMAGVW